MSETMQSIEIEIQNKKGLHARAAAAFVKTIENLDVEVTVERLGQTVNGCSIMGLMMLAASQGTTIKINAQGKQSEEAISSLKNLINSKFGEE